VSSSSTDSNPPARGVRVDWERLPPRIQRGIEGLLGGKVAAAVTQPGGFSPGLAARVRLEDGRRFFVKAVSEEANPDTPAIHRQEARIVAALPRSAPVPRFLGVYDEAGWVALAFEDVDGRHPHEPWTEQDLGLIVPTLVRMVSDLTPTPITSVETAAHGFQTTINGWQVALKRGEDRLENWALRNLGRLAELESRAPDASAGDTLLHFDTRADNLLIAGGRVYVIDWPWARIGAQWVDWVAMAPSVAMQGGPEPEDFLSRFGISGVSDEQVDAVLCTIAGFFAVRALDPPPRGIPTVRAFQAAQGKVAVAWLQRRVGWD
jgi:aminoglycoside phosphotransferase (APT) family kinase protein